MATTTYNIRIELDNENVSGNNVGEALRQAMSTLPDDTIDYSFDSFWGNDSRAEVELPLLHQDYYPRADEHVRMGTAFLTRVG